MITKSQFLKTAGELNVEVAAIQAVALVESVGAGFMPNGIDPVILFEPHIFWRQLTQLNIDPNQYVYTISAARPGQPERRVPNAEYHDILYPKWKPKAYGPVSAQHDRLRRACNIHRDAALSSCSWGRFQIMGFNWKACGYARLQDFVNAMYRSENDHLAAFCSFLKSSGLDAPLRRKDWAAFAKGYNGPAYKENKYDLRLADAYKVYFKLNFSNS